MNIYYPISAVLFSLSLCCFIVLFFIPSLIAASVGVVMLIVGALTSYMAISEDW